MDIAPPPTAAATATATATLMEQILYEVKRVVVGQDRFLERVMVAMLAQGHLLVEGVPGLAKTLTVKTLAGTVRGTFKRIQFTPDLVPADLVGTRMYHQRTGEFATTLGPVFTHLLLADEINRASPKTQSALLEAMEEKQVTVEGETRALPHPFFVIATQNPHDQLGTFALPESQLDRFLMRISIGYPDRAAERHLLAGGDRRDMVEGMLPLLSPGELESLQQQVLAVHAAEPLLDYVQDLIAATRSGRWFLQGLSPRAGIALIRAAKAQALIAGRDYVAPDDVQAVLPQTIAHRLVPVGDAGRGAAEQVVAMVEAVPLK
ncbi:AAA family ATPase [Paracidovorax cattleyae]|uniref:AAA family ATPase n=1 Tax=Paracidovorax cattleyae TaxID=80868 RepID=UPI0018AF7276|nr:MoxR family ATPase [Paracidovorax cattleyae]MBF9266425.1 MoxR family ATPase [Paracidovorax cattleyae]